MTLYAFLFQNNTIVLTLDLQDNWLEGVGGRHIAEMLKENIYITELVSAVQYW